MAELLKTTTSMGTLTMEQLPPTGVIMVTIKRVGYNRSFSKDKVVSVENSIGGGSMIGLRTVKLHMIGGEVITLRNVPGGPAGYIQQVLS